MNQETKWFNQPTREELAAANTKLIGWLVGALIVAAGGWIAFGVVVAKF